MFQNGSNKSHDGTKIWWPTKVDLMNGVLLDLSNYFYLNSTRTIWSGNMLGVARMGVGGGVPWKWGKIGPLLKRQCPPTRQINRNRGALAALFVQLRKKEEKLHILNGSGRNTTKDLFNLFPLRRHSVALGAAFKRIGGCKRLQD